VGPSAPPVAGIWACRLLVGAHRLVCQCHFYGFSCSLRAQLCLDSCSRLRLRSGYRPSRSSFSLRERNLLTPPCHDGAPRTRTTRSHGSRQSSWHSCASAVFKGVEWDKYIRHIYLLPTRISTYMCVRPMAVNANVLAAAHFVGLVAGTMSSARLSLSRFLLY
jgi:hypothetical protein